MRAFDQGAFYAVSVSANEIYNFNRRWPCSELGADHGITFTFDKRNGDLVDCNARESEDGPALLAMSEDAQAYGRKRLNLP